MFLFCIILYRKFNLGGGAAFCVVELVVFLLCKSELLYSQFDIGAASVVSESIGSLYVAVSHIAQDPLHVSGWHDLIRVCDVSGSLNRGGVDWLKTHRSHSLHPLSSLAA